ncbi:MAG: sugar ABC transporter ATP-binding protein [Spirochaetaceae bacterium]|nr:sugar ABC transporter ATP-binding protein [Spirochaetaceae bacterium]
MKEPILQLENITKYFPGIKALDQVHLKIYPGEIHALIGENGAGKSTLVKILTGVYQPTSGKVFFKGKKIIFPNALDAQKSGIAAIHQEASMFPELTVTENIYMGHHAGLYGKIDWRSMKNNTRELLEKIELDISPDSLIKNLSTAQRHMVEIAKALSINADVVIMDEPTSALTMREVEDLFKIINQLKKEGKAILFISHKFEEIFSICDVYTVFRDGRFIGSGKIIDTNIDSIITQMVGRSLDQMFPKKDSEITDTILEVKELSRIGYFKNISFVLKRGEILGFFGLVGAGRTEVMRVLFGIDKKSSGTIFVNGKKVNILTPTDAMNQGIALIPEDRHDQGVIQDMSLTHNISLPQIDKLNRFGILDRDKEDSLAQKYGSSMEIKAPNWKVNVNTLSGGNQQKVVLAKWIATNPAILIMDEPTKGIDVATKAVVHSFVSEMAGKGLAVVLVSSEMPEVLGMSDRIIVMHEGLVTASFTKEEADSEKIIRAATGHSVPEEVL